MNAVMTDKSFKDLLELIHELTGITIAENRTSMVEGRLRKRLATLGMDYQAYIVLVKSDREEQTRFVDLITTNETYFFRTPRIWDYIENKFLPQWLKTHPKQVFTAWSAAASSGEEAHSLGVVCQVFKEKHPEFVYQIIGTDISAEMVGLCQQGEYSGRSIEAFKTTRPAQFEKYMKKTANGTVQVIPEIKNRLKFQQHNLFNSFKASGSFDLILVRNVLIYFKGQDQEKVLSLMVPKLAADGSLIIGESESLSHINTVFKSIEPLVYGVPSAASSLKKTG